MKALALALMLMSAKPALAGFANVNLSGPGTTQDGQLQTLTLVVQNQPVTDLNNVVPSLRSVANGFNATLSAPQPAQAASIAPSASFTFLFTVSGTGCGSAQLSAEVAATENGGTPVPTATSNVHNLSLYCTPTPTPTATPVLTPTPTPWVVTAPRDGNARIRGNIYRPLQGQPLLLEAELPENAILRIDLFDRLGHKVKGFALEAGPGPVSVAWDGRSDDGLMVASGIYVAQFKARGFSRTVKFAVVK